MSMFAQVGRRADGRVFVVEDWVFGAMARVAHFGGTKECVTLTPTERATIELVMLHQGPPAWSDAARARAA